MVHDSLLSANIRRIMADKGMKQRAVAEKADISAKDLSAMLNGRKQILSAYINPIARALGVTPNELFAEDDTPTKAG